MQDVSILVQALPYIRTFRDVTFVVKIGGSILRDEAHLDHLARDLTLCHMVGIRLVVVHGGGPQANELSESLGFEPELVGGRRITDAEALEVAKMVFAGKVNTEILSAVNKHGGKAVGLSGIDAGLVRAHRRPVTTVVDEGEPREVDFGYVGDVDGVDPTVLRDLVERGFIPVVGSLAADEDGTILNVNADTIASELAMAVEAEKLVMMTGARGVYRDPEEADEIFSVLSAAEARGLLEDGTAAAGMRPKLEALCRAVEDGVHQAHVLDGTARHALLEEVFTDEGVGTMIARERREATS